MDRVDLFCWVPSLKYNELISPEKESDSKAVREKIESVRKIQKERFRGQDILTNSEMNIPQIKKYCQVDGSSQNVLKGYVDSGKLSARGYHRVLKVARTIADMDNRENISLDHITEALSYRFQED